MTTIDASTTTTRSEDVERARTTITRACIAGAFLAMSALLAACPGDLEDPSRFLVASSDDGTCNGIDVEQDLFMARCGASGCHGGSSPSAGLDLASPDPASRLVGVASGGCGGDLLIDPANPTGGVLLEKITAPRCGGRMPLLDDPLPADDIACVREWVASVASGGATPARDGGMPASDGGSR